MIEPDTFGRRFRHAWLQALTHHHPNTPSPASTAPWENLEPWEQHTAEHTYTHITELIRSTSGRTSSLNAYERGQLLTATWNAHVHCFHPHPPPNYTTAWEQLPTWRRHINTGIFEIIQTHVAAPSTQPSHKDT